MTEPAPHPDVADAATAPDLQVVATRRVRTLEGRLAGTPVAATAPCLALYFLLLAAAEVTTTYVAGRFGLLLHGAALLLMVTHAPLVARLNPALSRLLVAMLTLPLIRIVSLTSPLLQFSHVEWLVVMAVILYAGIVTSIKILKPSLASLGLRLPERRHLPLEIGIAIFGFALGYVEYQILRPDPLVASLTLRDLAIPVLVLFVSTGLLEELLFRGLLQKYAARALGATAGIVFVSALFGILHVGWESWVDVLFVTSVGLLYALVVRRTGSLLGVSLSHGVTNSMLFLVMPFLAG